MSEFVQLHAHSYYSLLEGLAGPDRLVQLAQQQSARALGLVDHLRLSGAVDFSRQCQAAGIQPILGLEVNVRPPEQITALAGPVVLLASDLSGWQNLCRLVAELLDEPDSQSHPVCSLEQLRSHARGLVCLSGGRRSLLTRLVASGQVEAAELWLREVEPAFAGRFYIELQNQSPADARCLPLLAGLADNAGLPLAASADIYYAAPDQAELHRILAAIRANRPLADIPGNANPNAHFPSIDEMARRFAGFESALETTVAIAQSCSFVLPFGQPQFPAIPLPPGTDAGQNLRKLAYAGARRLYRKISPEIKQRLELELDTIHGLGFEPIFLVMEEVMRFAHSAGIPVSSRGSAASSLVAHCLGITNPDPIELNLYFERFLNPARATPPDIDTDLCSRRRDLVLQHVFDTYGASHVAMVGTINRYRPRSALADVAKAHGFSPAEVRQLAGKMPYRFYYPASMEGEDGENDSPYGELEAAYPSARYQTVFKQAQALLGLPRHLSIHAGGIVITPGEVTDLIPVQRSNKGFTITQFDHKMLEPMGIIKLDLLGIRGLTVLGDVAEAVYSWRRNEYPNPTRVLETIPQDDPETANRIENGQTIGCFQIESPGMRATLKEIHAHSIADLIVALALYRPGPLTGGLKDAFVRRHNRQEAVTHIHPALAPILEDTYGVILYQEQVLRIAHDLAGLSLAESDLLRRAMSHFDPGRQMITLKQKFIRGAGEKSGVDTETAEQVWELMAAFAGYGFPKAHAASYALVAWQSAWCKTHFPAEFMSAVLANWGGYYSQQIYLMEARRMGLRVRPPHVNHSRQEFSVVYPDGAATLYMGLDQVRDLTRRTQQRTIAARPYSSLQDYLYRVSPRREEVGNLVRCGAFEGMGSIPELLRLLESGAGRAAGQLSLFDEPGEYRTDDWSVDQKAAAQEQVLGISVDYHPLERVTGRLQAAGALTTVEAAGRAGQKVLVAGVKQSGHRSRAAGGGAMMFLSLEDLEGMLDVVVFPEIYRRFRGILSLNEPLLIEGIMESDPGRDEPVLRAEKVYRVEA